MKTHYQILLSSAIFVVLFYDQSIGLNLSILGVIMALLTLVSPLFILKQEYFTLCFLVR